MRVWAPDVSMKKATVILLVAAFALALLFGAQTVAWSWGPAFLALALALGIRAFLPTRGGLVVGLSILPVFLWVVIRAAGSPVLDPARADVMLAMAIAATALIISGLRPGDRAITGLFAGLALVSLVNLSIGVMQLQDPAFTWPYNGRPSDKATGFFGHYNYFSNFTLGIGLLLAGRGFLHRDHPGLRALFLGTATWSAAMIVISGSRGGTLALGIGVVLLLGCVGALAWRSGAWWSKIFLVAFPLLLILVVGVGVVLLSKVQERRDEGGGFVALADNSARLEWMELSLKVAAEHPIAGGGSRAYSWERNHHWDVEVFGRGKEAERFVHNELLQTLADYGIVGAVLVLLPIGTVGWLGLSRIFLGGSEESSHLDSLAAGIIAAGGAVLFQANISFVFHLLPTAMLFGLLLGLGALIPPARLPRVWYRWAATAAAGILGFGALWLGAGGSVALHSVWPVLYSQTSLVQIDPEAAAARLDRASRSWPGYRVLQERGHASRIAAAAALEDPQARKTWNRAAVEAYQAAEAIHPFQPGLALNRANALSELGEAAAADAAYERALDLQGGLEAAFRTRFFYAKHLYSVWYQRWTDPGQRRAAEARWAFEKALGLIAEAERQASWGDPERDALKAQIEKAIAFLEGARVEARAPDGEVTE